jgi:hypothetical protein
MDTAILKRLLVIFVTILLSLTVFQAAAQSQPGTAVIESISVFAESGEPEQVVFKLNESHTPKTFRIEGERPRLVFDFFGIRYPAGVEKISGVGGQIIAGVRVGMHAQPLKTRVVVDIQKNSPYQFDYSFNVSSNQLVVTFSSDFPQPDPNEASQAGGPRHIGFEQLKVVYGTGGEKDPQEPPQPAPLELEQEQPQSGDLDVPNDPAGTVAAITADSAKKIVKPIEVEALPEAESEEPSVPQVAEKSVETQQAAAPVAVDQTEKAEPVDSVLLDVSFEKSINMSETVLFRLNHFSPPLVFGIEKGEPRVVCDFMGTRIEADIPELIEAGGEFVNRIAISTEADPNKVRVELILVPNRHYDLQQLFFKEDNLFVVIVKELHKEGS